MKFTDMICNSITLNGLYHRIHEKNEQRVLKLQPVWHYILPSYVKRIFICVL